MACLTSESKIHIHIVDQHRKDFRWRTDETTFLISPNDSFNDVRKKIIKKLESNHEYKQKHSNIILCLKLKHKLKVYIDKKIKNNLKTREKETKLIINKYNNNRMGEFELNDNVYNSIQNRKQIHVKLKNICIWYFQTPYNTNKYHGKSKNIENSNNSNNNNNNNNNYNHNNRNKSAKRGKKRNGQKLSDVTSKNKNNENKPKRNKKKRNRMEINDFVIFPERKKRKKPALTKKIRSNRECVWFLIDTAPTMTTGVYGDGGGIKYKLLQNLIKQFVLNIWSKPSNIENNIGLFLFGFQLIDVLKGIYCGYSQTLAAMIIQKLTTNRLLHDEYEECMDYKTAIYLLINQIRKDDIDKLERNRIILFTDGERGKSSITSKELIDALNKNNIIIDIIHITKSWRTNHSMKEITDHDGIGKYWNPINKTPNDYNTIITSDIMSNPKLRHFEKNIIEID